MQSFNVLEWYSPELCLTKGIIVWVRGGLMGRTRADSVIQQAVCRPAETSLKITTCISNGQDADRAGCRQGRMQTRQGKPDGTQLGPL
jgi:hypothetical protein